MPVSFCVEGGCKKFAEKGSYRCAEHRAENTRQWDKVNRNPDTVKFFNSAVWKRLRETVLNEHPVCQVEGCTQAAQHVDHIVARQDGGSWTDRDNLQALCSPHHSEKTQQELKDRKQRR